jgi:hypothetical protein
MRRPGGKLDVRLVRAEQRRIRERIDVEGLDQGLAFEDLDPDGDDRGRVLELRLE